MNPATRYSAPGGAAAAAGNPQRVTTGPGSPYLLIAARAMLLALTITLVTSPVAIAADSDDAERLRTLRARINSLQQELNAARGRRDETREEVHNMDRRIGELVADLKRIDAERRRGNARIQRLQRRQEGEHRTLRSDVRALERQVRAAFIAGRQEHLKLLLNQGDPQSLARVMTYYRYLNDARAQRIRHTEATLARIESLEEELTASNRELLTLRERQNEKKQLLESARTRRGEFLARLDRQVLSRSQEIERLRTDEQRLERLIRGLRSIAPEIGPAPDRGARFGSLKGRLSLPTRGRITARFNEPKQAGDLRWRGVFLTAPEGQDVAAVFRGRVAYAGWLRGFGLLLILDHGDGYMTLYGHNQSLFRGVGDWVEVGETIASVGNTGDAPTAGVYFEIRHNGEPRDPLVWCNAPPRGRSASR